MVRLQISQPNSKLSCMYRKMMMKMKRRRKKRRKKRMMERENRELFAQAEHSTHFCRAVICIRQ